MNLTDNQLRKATITFQLLGFCCVTGACLLTYFALQRGGFYEVNELARTVQGDYGHFASWLRAIGIFLALTLPFSIAQVKLKNREQRILCLVAVSAVSGVMLYDFVYDAVIIAISYF